jgi:serine phosphatase RsbU (regulator of sigma subunit)
MAAKMKIGLFTSNRQTREDFQKYLSHTEIEITNQIDSETAIAFIEADCKGYSDFIEKLRLSEIFTVLLVNEDKSVVPEKFLQPILANQLRSVGSDKDIDDVLSLPLRRIDLYSRVRQYQHLQTYRSLPQASQSIKEIIKLVDEDLHLATKLQKKFIPEKFSIPGFNIAHRYLSGVKSGGDYFDVFEFDDRSHVGFFMSDSTGYGLSSAIISVMLRMAFRFGRGEPDSPSRTLLRVFEELRPAMRDSENLAVFYGILNRHTLEMQYASVGSILFSGMQGSIITGETPPVTRAQSLRTDDHMVQFNPGDRIVLATDGFINAAGGAKAVQQLLNDFSEKDAKDLVNEFSYRAQKNLPSQDGMPEQDCSVIVCEIEKRTMRLIKG